MNRYFDNCARVVVSAVCHPEVEYSIPTELQPVFVPVLDILDIACDQVVDLSDQMSTLVLLGFVSHFLRG